MNKYLVKFKGRKLNAIGKFYNISETIEASNETNLKVKIYDNYEHITNLTIKEIK